jgi:hypothetical protein
MAEKQPTQALTEDGRKSAPDGTNRADPESEGHSAGGPYANPHSSGRSDKARKEGFGKHGGQSVMGYHGSGQLGDKDVQPGGNPNAGTKQR